METKNEFTQFFADKTGDKMFIEIEITGDVDEVVKKIGMALRNGEPLFDGAKVTQIMFRGRDMSTITREAISKALTTIQGATQEMLDTIRNANGGPEPVSYRQ